ncbi:MAG: hypothetical protein EA390_05445 [Balneolaceae bacterium]|nr:MAG: hypothetical protein EA390_05445 [Balneolaceae bacterium]
MKEERKYMIRPVAFLAVLLLMFSFAPVSALQAQTLGDLIEQARTAGIEQSRIVDLQNRAEARGISDEQLMNIIRPAIAMAEQNLPHEMIFDKAFEGISKRVPVQQIQPVLNSIAESSAQAAQFVDIWVERPEVGQMLNRAGERMDRGMFRNEMIKASSKGLMQNFDRNVMEQTLESVSQSSAMERARPSGIITAISILSDLPTAGQEPAESARIVLRALEGGFDASDLQKLPGAMNMAQRRSQLPAQAVAEGLARQLQGGLPASQILQNLFNGEVGGGPPGNVPPGLNRERPGRRGGPPGSN